MKKVLFVSPIVLLGFLLSNPNSVTAEEIITDDNATFEVEEIHDTTPQDLIFDQNPVESLLPANNLLYGTSKPNSDKKITGKTKYNYNGSYKGKGTLYTNYKFYGSKKYKVTVSNKGKSAIKVSAERTFRTYSSTNVAAGKTGSFVFSDINSDTRWWVKITGSNFSVSGTVSAN